MATPVDLVTVRIVGLALVVAASAPEARAQASTLLNVSYDPTRELYQAVNASFAAYWRRIFVQEDAASGLGARPRAPRA